MYPSIIILIILIIAILIYYIGLDSNTDDADYLVVLGHKLKNNQIDEILKYRLDKAIDYIKDNKCKIILSGGVTSNNTISEASAMKEYLIGFAVDEDNIILEEESKDTIDNINNCFKLIKPNKKVVIISSGYHLTRVKLICKKLKVNAKMLCCYTPFVELLYHLLFEEILLIDCLIKIRNRKL